MIFIYLQSLFTTWKVYSYGLEFFFSSLISTTSSVVFITTRIVSLLMAELRLCGSQELC